VAVACFLIDKGCDWTATNKKGRTAADELRSWFDVAEIFIEECDRRHLSYQMLNAKRLPWCVVGDTLHGRDSNGRMSSFTIDGIQRCNILQLK